MARASRARCATGLLLDARLPELRNSRGFPHHEQQLRARWGSSTSRVRRRPARRPPGLRARPPPPCLPASGDRLMSLAGAAFGTTRSRRWAHSVRAATPTGALAAGSRCSSVRLDARPRSTTLPSGAGATAQAMRGVPSSRTRSSRIARARAASSRRWTPTTSASPSLNAQRSPAAPRVIRKNPYATFEHVVGDSRTFLRGVLRRSRPASRGTRAPSVRHLRVRLRRR